MNPKRIRLTLVLTLAAALIAFAPIFPSVRQVAAKRPIALTTSSASGPIAGGSLSPNGQWYAYRLSPLQGDSRRGHSVDVGHAGMEVSSRRGRGDRHILSGFRQGRRHDFANPPVPRKQTPRAPAQPEQRHAVNLATGEKTTITRSRRPVSR
jgi:hypothetical protein